MVFYRKYRPQTIEDLDSAQVRDKLYSILSAKEIPHAFLFTGPKGLGKTSTARIVAKALNCEEKGEREKGKDKKLNPSPLTLNAGVEPCNKCDSCKSITNGSNVDVLEIDAASNRGIDEIRDLREKVRLSPARAAKKVYIIDEVHMLTTEAFNALLKTLEEPPSHVVFILCTTEAHKLPQTIVSRCTHIVFKKAGADELTRSFKRIVKNEKLDADEDALFSIAGLADGSFRDGSKILEEIALSANGKKITKDLVEEKYQIRQLEDQIDRMIEFLSKKNTKSALSLLCKLTEQGVDIKYLLEQIIGELHKILLIKVGVTNKESKGADSNLTINEIKQLTELLVKAHMELKYSVLPQLPLEMAIVEWGIHDDIAGKGVVVARDPAKQDTVFPGKHNNSSSGTDTFWQELIEKVKKENYSIAGILRGCSLKEKTDKKIIIETKYKFHRDKLNEKNVKTFIEKSCFDLLKNQVDLDIVLT